MKTDRRVTQYAISTSYLLSAYGCLTGFMSPVEHFEIAPGLLLRSTFVDTFDGLYQKRGTVVHVGSK